VRQDERKMFVSTIIIIIIITSSLSVAVNSAYASHAPKAEVAAVELVAVN